MAKSKDSSTIAISKPLAIAILILLPVIGFFFGSQYQRGAASQVNNVNSEFFNTEVSEKPRDKVISYTVQPGDTLPMVSRRFNISEDTIRWENKLVNDRLIE